MSQMSRNVLFITLDSCRFDTFMLAHRAGLLPGFSSVGPLHRAKAPSYFTYGSHAAFWMGFTPGVATSNQPFLNPKIGKLFRMSFSGHAGTGVDGFALQGANLIDGFRRLGYATIGSGAVDWFDPSTETGAVLGQPFEHFYFPGNTWSLGQQLTWIDQQLQQLVDDQPRFVFLNVGETHVPYWYEGAPWPQRPSPCRAFGGDQCDAEESARRQLACLAWADSQLAPLIEQFCSGTVLICADHGDCWGEDGLWEHGISHPKTLTVPLLMRVHGKAICDDVKPSPSRIRSVRARLKQWLRAHF